MPVLTSPLQVAVSVTVGLLLGPKTGGLYTLLDKPAAFLYDLLMVDGWRKPRTGFEPARLLGVGNLLGAALNLTRTPGQAPRRKNGPPHPSMYGGPNRPSVSSTRLQTSTNDK